MPTGIVAGFLAVVLLLGCDRHDVLRMRVSSGEPLAALASRADTTLLLVLEPQQCFSCGVDASTWSRFTGTPSRQALFVLTRPPGPRERTALIIRKITPNAVLASGQPEMRRTPRAYWIARNRVLREGNLNDQQTRAAVLQFLTKEPSL